ncbi:helix-turn-helix domain-containing protein [Palleronia sp. LCG004]|uniref:helix-turn-helix domain-containing protein n=1 Tax=Palleronia sp. LCG004 TaxID=3079304 RepID=UPI00294330A2|nr:RodZ domain-containing protein [Palleronia sp. LCG004]WOI54988.1 DUF4115 domain-containing protein [Palleronia sp. LCG004]
MIRRFRQSGPEETEARGFDAFDLRLGDVMRGERATLGKSLLDVQRELKIKATYIAAIENADPSAFETPGFIAGYVRSYARYLEMDPDWAFKAFCIESNFQTAHGMSEAASSKRRDAATPQHARDPFLDSPLGLVPKGDSFLSRIEPSAIGSVCVLLGLIGLIGYGGYAVLNEIQKVQVVPVDQAPQVVADIDPLDSARPIAPEEGEEGDAIASATSENFDRIYRPQALDVPVMVARDGPIANLDPSELSAFGGPGPVLPDTIARTERQETRPDTVARAEPASDVATLPEVQPSGVQVVADSVPEVVLMAVRPSWVRVRSADGTTIYEQIMQEGDTFTLPATEEPATLRTGESGALYFAINGTPYGPAGSAGQITSNLALSADNLTETYRTADLESDRALERVVAELIEARMPRAAPRGEADR